MTNVPENMNVDPEGVPSQPVPRVGKRGLEEGRGSEEQEKKSVPLSSSRLSVNQTPAPSLHPRRGAQTTPQRPENLRGGSSA